jgi:antitoxin HigA-1
MARTPIHPGEPLAEELRELGLPAAELARQIDVPANCLRGSLKGRQEITADTALRLGHWFGTSPEFWLNLQKIYELRLAQARLGGAIDRLPRRGQRPPVVAQDATAE